MDLENISYHLQMVQNLAALCQAMWMCGCVFNRVQKFGSLVSRPLGVAGMIDHKNCLFPKRITMTKLVAVCRMVGAHVGVSTILERSALLSLISLLTGINVE